ncbi:MAG: hypothetical protein ACOCV1_01645 [Bacillota bacterium]
MKTITELKKENTRIKKHINTLMNSIKRELNKPYTDIGYISEKLKSIHKYSSIVADNKTSIKITRSK